MKDSLWSVDLFRCESITLRSHWVMVVIDQFTLRIIGFAIHAGDCDGVAYCRMLNRIIFGKPQIIDGDRIAKGYINCRLQPEIAFRTGQGIAAGQLGFTAAELFP